MQNLPLFRYSKGRNKPKEGGVILDLYQLKGSILLLAALLIGLISVHDRSRGEVLEVRSRSSLMAQRKSLWRKFQLAPAWIDSIKEKRSRKNLESYAIAP